MRLPDFSYDIHSGPFENPEKLKDVVKGNCRLAVQVYFYLAHGIWLTPSQVLCPELYHSTGVFVFKDEPIDFLSFRKGDIVFSERVHNKKGKNIQKTKDSFLSEDDWIISLHTSIVISIGARREDCRFWHATAVSGSTCEWSVDKFEFYYRPVAVKRIELV